MIETTSTTTKQQTNKQIPKLYVLQYICQKKNCTKRYKTYYYKRKLKKEMPVRVLENRLCLFYRSLQNFLEKECDMRISRCVMPVG